MSHHLMSFFQGIFCEEEKIAESAFHASGNEDGGLENVGKARATRSELATQQWP